MKKRIISLVLVLATMIMLVSSLSSCQKDKEEDTIGLDYTVTHYATIVIEGYGKIKVELYGNEAPISVANFVKLANEGFYDGLTFHRIISGFMIQGGGFEKDGDHKDANTIKGEFAVNGVDNRIPHVRGVISMARTDIYDSGSSQFFIMHQASSQLDGQYAAFGKVIKGMYIVDEICNDVPQGYNGAVALAKRPVIKTITIKEA